VTRIPLIDGLRALGHPIGGVYLSRDAIAERVAELGAELAHAYADRNPLLVAPLKSSAVFLADLSRALSVTHELDFVELAPYSGGEGGAVRLLKDLDASAEGRDLLLVEDVVDTGLTLNFLMQTLSLRQVRSLAAVTLLDRPYRRLVEVPLAHVGFTVPDELFAGYGLGLDERWRALPDLHVLEADELPATVTGDGFHHGEPDAAAA
jgi:hypoxanthine phosphoribosyltransferase